MMFAVFITGLLVYTSDYNCTSSIRYGSVINISLALGYFHTHLLLCYMLCTVFSRQSNLTIANQTFGITYRVHRPAIMRMLLMRSR